MAHRDLTFRKTKNVSLCTHSSLFCSVANCLFFRQIITSIWESKWAVQCIPAMTDGGNGSCHQQIFLMLSCSVHSTTECTTTQLETRNDCQKFHWLVTAFVSQWDIYPGYLVQKLHSLFSRQRHNCSTWCCYITPFRGSCISETSILKGAL